MGTPIGHRPALGADQPGPAGRITTFVGDAPASITCVTSLRSISMLTDAPALTADEEIDRKPDRTEWLDVMLDTWRNRLCGRGVQCDIEGWIARHHKLQPSVANPNRPPGTVRHTVGTEQARGDGQLIPFRAGSGQTEALRKLGTIAERAIERRSDLRRSTLDMDDPRSELERRLVPYVLVVPARQLGDPVALLVEVEPRDLSFHRSRVVAQTVGSTAEPAPTYRLGSQPSSCIVLADVRRSPRGGCAR